MDHILPAWFLQIYLVLCFVLYKKCVCWFEFILISQLGSLSSCSSRVDCDSYHIGLLGSLLSLKKSLLLKSLEDVENVMTASSTSPAEPAGDEYKVFQVRETKLRCC